MKKTVHSAASEIVLRAFHLKIEDKDSLTKVKNEVCKEFKINTFSDMELLSAYRTLEKEKRIKPSECIKKLLQKRSIRTLSGIAPVSVLMPPAPCKSACVYCPSERANSDGKTLFQIDTEKKYGRQNVPKKFQRPGALVMPKSYISSEPGAMRALLAGFDPFVQISRRLASLERTGHSAEKCELIVQGGTFSDLPKRSRTHFITRCYQAFNEGGEQKKPSRSTLLMAQKSNEVARHRIIGLTLETRPGSVTPEEIREFRRLGCTRVELGVQTLDDDITKKTRRLQSREEVVRATRLLRQAGFKICYHIMPGLPFSTPEKDLETYHEICNNPDFCPDLIKIYPCAVVPFSELEKWYKTGKFQPYSDEVLFELLWKMKKRTPPWIRISRLVRDIPGTAILGGSKKTNLRQLIQEKMHKKGEKCSCIRCREIRDQIFDRKDVRFVERIYESAGGEEHFLSYELPDGTLLAMLRLRIPGKNEKPLFLALSQAGIIRELHTFGHALPVKMTKGQSVQHIGFGKQLLQDAERITSAKGLSKLTVISGVGVKEFYRQIGFSDSGTYLVKKINEQPIEKIYQ